jgi:hypothetical protein
MVSVTKKMKNVGSGGASGSGSSFKLPVWGVRHY